MTRLTGLCGTAKSELRLADAELCETFYPPMLEMPRHGHEPAYFTCVLSGGYDETLGRTERRVEASAILLHPRGEEHAVRFGPAGSRILNIRVADDSVGRMRRCGIVQPLDKWRRTRQSDWLVARIHAAFSRGDAAAKLMLEGMILELLASGFSHDARPDCAQCVAEALEYLHAHFAEPVSLGVVARMHGVHPAALARAFRRRTGVTLGEYVRRLRVGEALRLVRCTDMPLAEIAGETGFSDQAHLTRIFRDHTGSTPGQVRRSRFRG